MNIKSFIRKRRFLTMFESAKAFIVNAFTSSIKLVFTKRTILFVTSQKIRSVTLGPIAQLCIFITIAWIVNLFFQSIQYNKIINEKSQEIARLNSVNSYFETEFNNINERLRKVNDYLLSVTGRATPASSQNKEFKTPESIKEDDLTKTDKHTLNQIKDAVFTLSDIQAGAGERIEKLEKAIAVTGLKIKTRNKSMESAAGQGGPLIPVQDFTRAEAIKTSKFVGEINRLITLERLTQVLPFARPMKSYFVSSGFGTRTDPITGGYARHQGLDFVGPSHEKIISPSAGRVILAGAFSDYGNAVVIDHGFGITTRYGHLSKVKVAKGQIVKKGDVIALQGSTGRSTGQHLHYEIRYKNTPLNPKKFLEAGDAIFNDKTLKHADS